MLRHGGHLRADGSVISSVLFGALAAAGVLPFPRDLYEQAIRKSGVAVEANLAGFAAGFEQALKAAPVAGLVPPGAAPSSDAGRRFAARIRATFPAHLHGLIVEGVRRLMDYQDAAYADLYMRRLTEALQWDEAAGGLKRGFALTAAVARHLALWMSYEDTIRVADLKTRRRRFERFRGEVSAAPEQIVYVTEYMHPRLQELCETLPAALGERLARSRSGAAARGPVPPRPPREYRQAVRVHRPLSARRTAALASRHLRYRIEQARIGDWLARIRESASGGAYDLAVEIAECQRLIKGYGDTHERGLRHSGIMQFVERERSRPQFAAQVRRLRSAALADEDGRELDAAMKEIVGYAAGVPR